MINSAANKIGLILTRMNTGMYVALFVVMKLLLNAVSNVVNLFVTKEPLTKGFAEIVNAQMTFFLVVVVGPIIETYLSQYLFFKHLSGRLNKWAIIVLSAIFFALLHHYNVGYIFYAFFSGLLLSTSYALRLSSNAFVCTALIHSIHNLIGFVYNHWHWQ